MKKNLDWSFNIALPATLPFFQYNTKKNVDLSGFSAPYYYYYYYYYYYILSIWDRTQTKKCTSIDTTMSPSLLNRSPWLQSGPKETASFFSLQLTLSILNQFSWLLAHVQLYTLESFQLDDV